MFGGGQVLRTMMNHAFHVFMPDFLASLHVCALNYIYNHIYIHINTYVCMTDTILLDTISGPTVRQELSTPHHKAKSYLSVYLGSGHCNRLVDSVQCL